MVFGRPCNAVRDEVVLCRRAPSKFHQSQLSTISSVMRILLRPATMVLVVEMMKEEKTSQSPHGVLQANLAGQRPQNSHLSSSAPSTPSLSLARDDAEHARRAIPALKHLSDFRISYYPPRPDVVRKSDGAAARQPLSDRAGCSYLAMISLRRGFAACMTAEDPLGH